MRYILSFPVIHTQKMKFNYVNVGFWTENGKAVFGIMPDHVVKQINTPQWMTDQVNESLFPAKKLTGGDIDL